MRAPGTGTSSRRGIFCRRSCGRIEEQVRVERGESCLEGGRGDSGRGADSVPAARPCPDGGICAAGTRGWKCERFVGAVGAGEGAGEETGRVYAEGGAGLGGDCRDKGMARSRGIGARQTDELIQPPATIHIDLRADEQAILGRMKSKWRYNIRLAEKKGVHVREGMQADFETFYELMKVTGERDKFAIHGLKRLSDGV